MKAQIVSSPFVAKFLFEITCDDEIADLTRGVVSNVFRDVSSTFAPYFHLVSYWPGPNGSFYTVPVESADNSTIDARNDTVS